MAMVSEDRNNQRKPYIHQEYPKFVHHEDCVQKICKDLFKLMKPKYIEVMGDFTPRGGIAIFPYASMSNGSKDFAALKMSRMANYAPGKYGMDLSRLY